MYKDIKSNDLQEIITHAIAQMKADLGLEDDEKINLAELERRTGIPRGKLRGLQKNGFAVKPHGNTGSHRRKTKLDGFTDDIDDLLRQGIRNSELCYTRIRSKGYQGGKTTIKNYIESHLYLMPPKRRQVDPQGNRGRRYLSGPGESYQMDWGFANVETAGGTTYKIACFAMICHCCGERYIEFFPNAKQENLFIGMIHAFQYMGIPQHVLTDNMKSVVIRRDAKGHPIWQKDYEQFMKSIGFETKLCKPRHPFTKGTVERLVRFVKNNFLAGRLFVNITELNIEALEWCSSQNRCYHRAVDCIPEQKHLRDCMAIARQLLRDETIERYLNPSRIISFDGFIHFEGRRFGVPYWYAEHTCRVRREGFTVFITSEDLSQILSTHDVTWSRRDSYCRDQYDVQPEEEPTAPVRVRMRELVREEVPSAFDKFDFSKEVTWR